MLRDAGVRTKLLAVLAIPTLLLVAVTGLLVSGQVAEARRAGQVTALTDVAIQVNRLVHSLQEERSATLSHLEAPDAGTAAELEGQRGFTDVQLRSLSDLLADSSLAQVSPTVADAVRRATAGHDELAAARRSVDAGRFFATEADVFYGKVIRADLELPGAVAASATAELGRSLQAYQALSTAIELAAHERDLVEVALLSGRLTEPGYAATAALVAQQREALADFQAKTSAPAYARLDEALAGAANYEVDQVRRGLTDLLRGRGADVGTAVEWVGAANSRISAMTESESALVSEIASTASATQAAQEQRALLLVVVSVLGLGLAAMLAVSLARRITRPLRRLTVAAGEIGDELPRMVERMQTPGEGPGVEVEPIPVESGDEIGRLAEAFNTVNDVTVQVAREQAALRASIAEMFVNVARRNQVLLGRQLKALDAMEAREEDPDALARLFTLDHLATRMRRNAESLLVLAGIDSTRRLRGSLPLSDVIRTAVGEIEAYDRIDLAMTSDPEVSGRHALTVAHLLAELLENATHFSNPDTRVVVSAAPVGSGVSVTVTDSGLGMTEEEVAAANAAIAAPPVAEIAVSQRLGLFVVGRLAARLGAAVQLRRGRSAGVVVTVSLPTAVFENLATAPGESEDAAERVAEPHVAPQLGLEPVAEPHVAPQLDVEPVATPFVPAAFTPTVDILPGRGSRMSRRASLPVRTPAVVPPPAPAPGQAPLAQPALPAQPRVAEYAAAPPTGQPTQPAQPTQSTQRPEQDQPEPALSSSAVAMAELRGIYEPSFTPAAATSPLAPAGLARRTPKAAAASPAVPPSGPPLQAPARPRTATEVRGMLAGFRAGVERGRTPEQRTPEPQPHPLPESTPVDDLLS